MSIIVPLKQEKARQPKTFTGMIQSCSRPRHRGIIILVVGWLYWTVAFHMYSANAPLPPRQPPSGPPVSGPLPPPAPQQSPSKVNTFVWPTPPSPVSDVDHDQLAQACEAPPEAADFESTPRRANAAASTRVLGSPLEPTSPAVTAVAYTLIRGGSHAVDYELYQARRECMRSSFPEATLRRMDGVAFHEGKHIQLLFTHHRVAPILSNIVQYIQ